MRKSRCVRPAFVGVVIALLLTGCGDSTPARSIDGDNVRGPIKIWLSNNKDESAWGNALVKQWNAANPDQPVSVQEIPAGKSSEEVIGAAVTAGTTPCLIYNVAPAAVDQFQQAGGLVNLSAYPDGNSYIEARTGPRVNQFRSSDGKFYQMPWKQNPVLMFYNKKIFRDAGLNADNPPIATWDDFLATSKTLVASGKVLYAIGPSPSGEGFQSWFDFYPTFIAQTGLQLVVDNQAAFATPDGKAVGDFWRQLYVNKLAPTEVAQGDRFPSKQVAMTIVGPWAAPLYKDMDFDIAPLPTRTGTTFKDLRTFSDEKSVGMFTSCNNRGTAWDFLRFSTSVQQDGALLDATGQLPVRQDIAKVYADYFVKNPKMAPFAAVADQVVEVPNVTNSVQVWQTFRDYYVKSVIFGNQDVSSAFDDAASKINKLVTE